jgi:beta-glucuronidase
LLVPFRLRTPLAACVTLVALAAPIPAAGGGEPPRAGAAQADASVPSAQVLIRNGHGSRYLVDGTWLFRADPQDQGLARGFARETDTGGWTPVSVPNAWNATDLSDDSQRGSVGWYRKDFRLPRAQRGARWAFRFESVNYRAQVFLNGRRLARHEGGYLPFEVPASALRGGVNRLVVRVDNRRSDTDLPPARDQANGRPGGGWWNYGGLLREVYIRRVDGVDLEQLLVSPRLPCRSCDATVEVRAIVRNNTRGRRRAAVRATIGGATLRSPSVQLAPGARRELRLRGRIRNPRLWEPRHPELYTVRARVLTNGRGGTYATRVGVRDVRVDRRGRMLLNGRAVQLRGASMHEDDPRLGGALGPAERTADVELLKALGATITRAHYPVHPQTLEMLDREGILMWDQIPFYQLRETAMRQRSVREKGLRALEEMMRRDWNNPSVIVYSIANELPTRVGTGQRLYVEAAARLVRRLDPTRLSAIDFAGYPSATPSEVYRRLDAIGFNSYFGWYPGPNGQIIDRELLSPYIDQLHESYPREALFVTEFGAEANREGPIDEKGTYAFQRDFMQFHVTTYDQNPHVNGAIAWILRDFRVRPDWDGGNPKPAPPVNFKGLVSEDRVPKPSFEDTARLYRNVEPFR